MTVLLICFVRRGGMVHYSAQLANALVDIAQVELIIPDCVDTSYFDSRITLHRIPAGQSGRDTILKLFNPRFLMNLRKLFRGTKAEVVHISATHPWNVLAPLFSRKPVLFTVHDPVHHSGESWYIQLVDALMKRWATGYFVHDKQGAQALAGQVPSGRLITVVPHGDYSMFVKASDDYQENTFLFFGRIEEYKGIGTLLNAWPTVSNTLPDWRLIIAGQGDLSAYAEQLANQAIEVHNRYITDNEVTSFFARSGVIVLPYHDATQSGVLMIAAAMSRPVIATQVGAIPTIVKDGDNGLLIPPRDSQALAEAMIYLAKQSSVANEMGKALHKTVKKESSWLKSARGHMKTYTQLIKS